MSSFLLPALTLWQREIVRFLRQRSRIIGAFGQPLLFWLVIGSGFGRSFRSPGGDGAGGYAEYFFTGVLAMVVLFTAIFSTFSVVEDRQQRFLQGVLAAPVPRPAIVLGQALGGTTLGLLQGVLLLAAAPFAGVPLTTAGAAAAVAVMALMGFALTSLGLVFAWRMDSAQGFHSIINMLLIPLWLLSEAVFPAAGAHPILAFLMQVNPLTYGVAALRRALYLNRPEALAGLPGIELSLLVTVLFAFLAFLAAVRTAERSAG